ncbi:MAG: GAF domain-containing sensor histidine kinase [Steroidobacteraceae bacterium]
MPNLGSAAVPSNESQRLASLDALQVLDTAPEAEFDALVRAASLVCGTPISLISLVDHDRQWFKASVGLPGATQTTRDVAFCAHAIHGAEIFEVRDALLDPRFHDNPLVKGAPDIRFYAGAPLVLSDGSTLGTLCVIDREPRELSGEQREILGNLAHVAVKALEGRRAALELADRGRQLRQLHGALEIEHQHRGDFLATLAHELRNPLAALRGATQVMKLARGSWATVEKVSGIFERQVAHMVRLVEDLTEASKVAAGKIDLDVRVIDLGALLTSALDASLPQIEMRHHELDVQVPAGTIRVRLDMVRMVQVLSNLLVNAAKYTPEGGRIAVRATCTRTDLTIDVQDNGIGIAPEVLPSIFGMFVQVQGRSLSGREGLGVGLAVVERLVRLHGGTVVAASDGVDHGSRFSIHLPGVVVPG